MRENYFHVYSSALFGACIVIMGVKVHEELLESGKFDTTLEAIRFYYNASLMIQSWFTGNIYEKKSKYVPPYVLSVDCVPNKLIIHFRIQTI